MKILFAYPSLWGYFYGRKYDYFILEVARQTECKIAGQGYPDHIEGEKLNDTINRLYINDEPDWVFGHNIPARMINRNYKLASWVGDIHVTMAKNIRQLNAVLDAVFMRCKHTVVHFPTGKDFRACFGKNFEQMISSGHCVRVSEDYFVKQLNIPSFFLPWSVNPTVFKPVSESEKKYDVTLMGSVGRFYPLRLAISEHLPRLASKKHWRFLNKRPPNIPKLAHNIQLILDDPELRKKRLVGEDYAKAVAESKIFVFGSGIARYPVRKYFEGMMSGSLVMADKPFHAEELHFKSGWNFVEINAQNWQQTLTYYLEDDQLRETIARRGYETALKYHTHEVRAKEFISNLQSVK